MEAFVHKWTNSDLDLVVNICKSDNYNLWHDNSRKRIVQRLILKYHQHFTIIAGIIVAILITASTPGFAAIF